MCLIEATPPTETTPQNAGLNGETSKVKKGTKFCCELYLAKEDGSNYQLEITIPAWLLVIIPLRGLFAQAQGFPSLISKELPPPLQTLNSVGRCFKIGFLDFGCFLGPTSKIRGMFLEIVVESNWNSFDSIRKFAIRLIRKGKKYLNLMKINSKFV